jgi:hypothetical protein
MKIEGTAIRLNIEGRISREKPRNCAAGTQVLCELGGLTSDLGGESDALSPRAEWPHGGCREWRAVLSILSVRRRNT